MFATRPTQSTRMELATLQVGCVGMRLCQCVATLFLYQHSTTETRAQVEVGATRITFLVRVKYESQDFS